METNWRLGLQNYRYWTVWRCPSVRFLDYEKVKEAERQKGRELFGTVEEPTALASQVSVYHGYQNAKCK